MYTYVHTKTWLQLNITEHYITRGAGFHCSFCLNDKLSSFKEQDVTFRKVSWKMQFVSKEIHCNLLFAALRKCTVISTW